MENNKRYNIKLLWRYGYYRKSFINYMLKGYLIKDRRHIIAIIYNIIKNAIIRGNDDIQIIKTIVDVLNTCPVGSKNSERVGERVNTVSNLVNIKVNKYLDYNTSNRQAI